MMSDDSENDGVYVDAYENDIYYKKYKLLLAECENIQKNNERLVFRINQVKKITNKRVKHIAFLKRKLLNEHAEEWNVIPKEEIKLDEDDLRPVYPCLKQMIAGEKADEAPEDRARVKKAPKRKGGKTEKDPNAPKRPSNPFFQFCQEQRQILMEQINAELKPGDVEPSKQELTRQLAIKWKSLSGSDKQVYVDMYERSKEKYNAEMNEYNMKK